MTSAAIFGFSGTALTADERDFFRDVQPYGYIVFARNIDTPDQVKRLTAELRELAGGEALPILIDQEGGRVARLRPPHWRKSPSAAELVAEAMSVEDARQRVYLNARLLADELRELGITVNCAPVADIPVAGADAIISDRAYGTDAETVATLAAEMARGLTDSGVLPVVKHIPGHGRATVDSHHALPVVDAPLEVLQQTDFAPFKALAHLPYAMTAHIIYTAIDPDHCATMSPAVIQIVREQIGFKGLLMTDDLSMNALSGDFAERTRAALAAGCDLILHCNGDMVEMQAIAGVLPTITSSRVVLSTFK